ncbi:hypothetical protein CAPTEDRAFT_192373 [Capitella teleta]|uniref:Retrotransposon gag domain-containing protein n=1 Tax=Capitella teleta TaxID=283909 RepID=R7UL21_CAPTE|nr:hypothetical protein CAPTEDRAFT_192373 [Capitella teleta]|eukprot:ELU04483.1 hypothetical protein CAPTEDRAFT_192373 [Capitella teleta]
MEYDSFTGPQANETIRAKPEANGRRIRINEFTLESDEGDTESDLEINRDEQDALKFFSAIADVSATERFIKRVGFCDGDKPSRTLEWLRAIDRLPDNVQVEIALQTAESTIHSSLRELKNAKWPKIKTLLANRYVNANFSEAQKEALDRLEQRPGEGLYNYITTFEVLLNEAYQALPLDQTSLIRTFLSGLSDRDMAKSVARKKLRTLPEVVKEVRQHYQDDDLLRSRKISKVHAIDKYENPQVSALSVVVTDLVNMQKETNAQIAALAKAVVNAVIDAYRDIFSVKATPVNVARSLPPAVIDTAAIKPSTPTPVVVPADIPDVWVTDRIDLHDLARSQKEQFCDAYVEASQETDESPYIVQGSLIFTMAEPSRNAGRYLRLLLPQQFRQQVIDRCHAEVLLQ